MGRHLRGRRPLRARRSVVLIACGPLTVCEYDCRTSACRCRAASRPLTGGRPRRPSDAAVARGRQRPTGVPVPASPSRPCGPRCGPRDKQAALLVTMPSSKGITTAGARRTGAARRPPRQAPRADARGRARPLGSVRSSGELDFARECRRRGIPEPTRQSFAGAARSLLPGRVWADSAWWSRSTDPPRVGRVGGRTRFVRTRSPGGGLVLRLPLLGCRVAATSSSTRSSAAWRPEGGAGRPDVGVRHGRWPRRATLLHDVPLVRHADWLSGRPPAMTLRDDRDEPGVRACAAARSAPSGRRPCAAPGWRGRGWGRRSRRGWGR